MRLLPPKGRADGRDESGRSAQRERESSIVEAVDGCQWLVYEVETTRELWKLVHIASICSA